jgi:hypothetical protein
MQFILFIFLLYCHLGTDEITDIQNMKSNIDKRVLKGLSYEIDFENVDKN